MADNAGSGLPIHNAPTPSRTQYYLSRKELIKGVANRFVFSQVYIYLYLGMAALSLTTVVLSLLQDCPGLAFYVLEIIINSTMILEVGIRLVAFGKQFWKSYYNTIDLVITVFCVITLMVVFFSGCSAKGEELFDTFLLVARNIIQFGRLALVMRRSGKSIFSPIRAIDLSTANLSLGPDDMDIDDPAYFSLDLDLDDEEALTTHRMADGGDDEARRERREREQRLGKSAGGGGVGAGGGNGSGGAGGNGKNDQTRPFLIESDDED